MTKSIEKPVLWPLVSIVVPTYNQAKYLKESLESVINQSYPNIEMIIINDGSTDETEEVLNAYVGHPKIRIETQVNMGQALTLNRGWQMARGEYLGYLSSDDILHQDCIRKVVQALEVDSAHICAYPNASLIDERSRIVRERVCRPFSLYELVVKQECYIGPGALFRRKAFEKFGGWESGLRLGPDREYWMRLSSAGTFFFLDEVLAGYRYHPGSISYRPATEEISRQFIEILDKYYAQPGVPELIQAGRDEAYAHAHFRVSIDCLRSWSFTAGVRYYRRACELHSEFRSLKMRVRLLKSVMGKPIRRIISMCTGLTRLNR